MAFAVLYLCFHFVLVLNESNLTPHHHLLSYLRRAVFCREKLYIYPQIICFVNCNSTSSCHLLLVRANFRPTLGYYGAWPLCTALLE